MRARVPNEPFPNINDRDQFRELHGLGTIPLGPLTREQLAENVGKITERS